MDIDERILKLEMLAEQHSGDIAGLKKQVTDVEKTQVEAKLNMMEMRGDIKSVLTMTTNLNSKWEKFDEMQKKNANDLKMKTIGAIIVAIIAFIFAYLKLK
jgi:tetrahydromethanopterin S-methyltransferase subunit H